MRMMHPQGRPEGKTRQCTGTAAFLWDADADSAACRAVGSSEWRVEARQQLWKHSGPWGLAASSQLDGIPDLEGPPVLPHSSAEQTRDRSNLQLALAVFNVTAKIYNMLLLQIAALFTRAQLAFIEGGRCHGLPLIVLCYQLNSDISGQL